MNKFNRTTIILLVFAGAAVAWWVWSFGSQGAGLRQENTTLKQQLAKATERASASATEVAHLRSLLSQNSGPAEATDSPDSAHKRNFQPEELKAMATSTGMQNIIASLQAAVIQMAYKDLLDHLQLSPEERDYMQKLLLDLQMTKVTLGMQYLNPALSPEERTALGEQMGQGMAADNAKISDFLNSSEDYAYYQSYSQQEPEHTEVGMFESALTGDDALDPATADALASLLNNARTSFPFTVDFNNQATFGNPAVLNNASVNKFMDEQAQLQAQEADKAASLLTPTQLQAFKLNQAAMQQMAKLRLSNIVQMAGGGQ